MQLLSEIYKTEWNIYMYYGIKSGLKNVTWVTMELPVTFWRGCYVLYVYYW